jgi:predicted membrane protein
MDKFEVKGQRLVALCILGVLLFNYPMLAVFNVASTVFGIPLLYVYIFVVWTLLTACMAYVVEKKT